MPCIWYSTGSSTVMILRSGSEHAERRVQRRRFSRTGRPVIRMTPLGALINRSKSGSSRGGTQRLETLSTSDWSRIRMTRVSRGATDAQVELLVGQRQLDAAVLRNALFGQSMPDKTLRRETMAFCQRPGRRDFGEHTVRTERIFRPVAVE